MEILVDGWLKYREFVFPGRTFSPLAANKIIASVGANNEADRWPHDLSPQARNLAVDIINLGGVKEVVFHENPPKMAVWTYQNDFWDEGLEKVLDLIKKHYPNGRENDLVFTLPFGVQIVIPR